MKKKLCSLLLAILLIVSLFPLSTSQTEADFSGAELLEIWDWLIPKMLEENVFPLELRDLKRGNKGEQVIMLQARLRQLNYYRKALDGSFGTGTLSAWKAFEKAQGWKADGIASIEEQLLLYSTSAIAKEAPLRSRTTKKPRATPKPGDNKYPSLIDNISLNPDARPRYDWFNPGATPTPSPTITPTRMPYQDLIIETTSKIPKPRDLRNP